MQEAAYVLALQATIVLMGIYILTIWARETRR